MRTLSAACFHKNYNRSPSSCCLANLKSFIRRLIFEAWVTSSSCSSPPLSFPIFPSTATTLGHKTGDTQSLVAGPSENRSKRVQLILTKAVYTDGGRLHYFCEGREGGGEGGGLAEFTEVVYKPRVGRRWRAQGQNTSSLYHIISLYQCPPSDLSTLLLTNKFYFLNHF